MHQDDNLEILLNQMQKFRWEILGLAETHSTEYGEFAIGGYKILSSGNLSVHRKGVGMILNKVAQSALLGYNPISPRIISARFQTKTGAITIIQVYPPNTADNETCVYELYDQLQRETDKTPKNDILIIMGDLNAKVESNDSGWETVMGKYGLGESNARGEKLFTFCACSVQQT
ncbi:craniofacial development protein 2-like [Amphiura filiformis]|uniref:craniofacial development protein 2-like n=1 Tax=Amphiura filiformis TaxID=82378 RepID=UPI003B20CF20